MITTKKLRRIAGTLYTNDEITEMFHRFALQRPNPKSELRYTNAYTLLVAVALSAQATDISVNKATNDLFKVADSPEKMLALGEEGLADYIRTIGLWRSKAKNIIILSKALIESFHSQVPQKLDDLMSLAGVGRKTANVVLNIIFDKLTLAVDTHIFRIGNRIGLAPGNTPDEVEQKLLKIIPKNYLKNAHNWLILHGRYVCKARKPDCKMCIIADICQASIKTNAIPAPIIVMD